MKPLDILIVDDDRDLADAIGEALEMVGHRPTIAYSGTEAIETYCGRSFDMTFMDVKLPDINGVETFMTIREMDPNARVVMMTGYRIDQLLAQATDNGAIKVLRKPFAMEEILTSIEEVRPGGLVLVADDDPDFVESAEHLLAEHGYDVLIARNGAEAIEKVISSNPDLLLLDLRMPVMHGLDVYLELKKLNRLLPTIIITAYPRDEINAVSALKSLAVTGCLFKPFEPEALLQAIADIQRERETVK
ncbi:MAG: response regulator [Alphaproteobacteria bacterium]|nr:response regulator [Alphaproteobacteria bacterium]